VLIEGSDDADDLIPHIVSPKSKLPIAILAYTTTPPVRTFVYPLAIYSPEYQALVWCHQHKAKARFMDLPSSVFLGLQERDERDAAAGQEQSEEEAAAIPADQDDDNADAGATPPVEAQPIRESIYHQIARIAGELDYETYWERHFEQLRAENSFRDAARS